MLGGLGILMMLQSWRENYYLLLYLKINRKSGTLRCDWSHKRIAAFTVYTSRNSKLILLVSVLFLLPPFLFSLITPRC